LRIYFYGPCIRKTPAQPPGASLIATETRLNGRKPLLIRNRSLSLS
jgi:hypothetical protein